MSTPGRLPECEQLAFEDLVAYAAVDLDAAEAEALEAHLFTCATCATRADELDALARAVSRAATSGQVSGFSTDDMLNRLARDGVRVRTFTLDPGSVVPCAVWEGDEVMAIRLRGDFGTARQVTLSRRVAGAEVLRVTGDVVGGTPGEIIYTEPAARIREFPAVPVELEVTTREDGHERSIGTYTLMHGGSLHR